MDNVGINGNFALVLDFDGTMCRVFKNYDLTDTAKRMSCKMKEFDIDFSPEKDVFEVFEEIICQSGDNLQARECALRAADEILTVAEVQAVETGEIVKGVGAVMQKLQDKGILMGVSTNNSVECVKHFMEINCPKINIPIVGRVGIKPELMKPNIWSLTEVVSQMGCMLKDVVFIGDSNRDYYCAKDAGVDFLGMAPAEYKRQRLLKLLPGNEIATDFEQLLTMLKKRYPDCL